MIASRPCCKITGRYVGRIFKSTSKSASGLVDIISAAVIYVDESGIEHHTGYEHPRERLSRSEDWDIRKGIYDCVAADVSQIAHDFQDFLTKNGIRFELAHPSWWAPGIDEQPPYWADEDDQDDLLAA
jgi:hypothetical protein